MHEILHGDSLQLLGWLDDNSVDAVVTDPPYGLKFMGKHWDYDVPSVELWREVFRVLKPGGHVLSFGGTRTYHRMVVNIEDAGFEIRDQLQWLYGSGFPKSHDVSKGIDKAAGAEREVVGQSPNWRPAKTKGGAGFDKDVGEGSVQMNITAPSTDIAKQWQGWGTALKPANEPIVLARKPLVGTVASNVEKFGTGALNIDASRIGVSANDPNHRSIANKTTLGTTFGSTAEVISVNTGKSQLGEHGRWPANVLFSEEAAAALDAQSGRLKGAGNKDKSRRFKGSKVLDNKVYGAGLGVYETAIGGDSGGASRFFYVAKASKRERGEGNNHPTVKPTKLMEYLVRMITPPNGVVLDPFMGSGTTGVACKNLSFQFVGIERDAAYIEIAKRRIEGAKCGWE